MSEVAIHNIKRDPSTWDQTAWHTRTPSRASHCYAGHVDIILGAESVEKVYNTSNDEDYPEDINLVYNVQGFLGLNNGQWTSIINMHNSVAQLEEYHERFFVLRSK